MPFSKSYLQSYLGNDFIQSVFNEHLDNIKMAYDNDLATGEINQDYTFTEYIEDYITHDMGFIFNNDLDSETDDIMYKRLGKQYEILNDIYDRFVEHINNRWPSYNLPSLADLITDLTFWQPLETYTYKRINGNGDNQ